MARPTSLCKRRSISMGVTSGMLLSTAAPDHVMGRRVTNLVVTRARGRGWAWAAAGSAAVHAALLVALIALGGDRETVRPETVVVDLVPTPVELAAESQGPNPSN